MADIHAKRKGANDGFLPISWGQVDPKAYPPNAKTVAKAGYLVTIPPMPQNLASLDVNAASEIAAASPRISHWAIGGPSLGGSRTAAFSHKNPDLIQGLVL